MKAWFQRFMSGRYGSDQFSMFLSISALVLLVLGLELPADLVAIAFSVVGIFNSLSVLEGRRKDKEEVSYNLLWGQLALTILLVACAVLAVKQRLGL